MNKFFIKINNVGTIRFYKIKCKLQSVEFSDGTKFWYKECKLHRENGPAIEYPGGSKIWYKVGKIHREDGPAIEYADGTKEWYLEGKEYTKKEFLNLL